MIIDHFTEINEAEDFYWKDIFKFYDSKPPENSLKMKAREASLQELSKFAFYYFDQHKKIGFYLNAFQIFNLLPFIKGKQIKF